MSELDPRKIRLTETVQKGGCAAKLPAGQLREVLQGLKLRRPAELKVGLEHMDDACLYSLPQGLNLIQTLDFFTPIVDDAYDFGSIAAANALSDVYAMGGLPKIALSILAFPSQTLPLALLRPLLQGAIDKIHEAGACLAGGHTIEDESLKFGLSVTGFVQEGKQWTNAGANVGDVLILTKPLGTGTITSALKRKEIEQDCISAAIVSMQQLNRAPELLLDIDVHSATDITGFGLAGHALQLAQASRCSLKIDVQSLPVLQGALACLQKNIINRAHRSNWDYVKGNLSCSGLSEAQRLLLVDPQTSGGLLLVIEKSHASRALERLKSEFRFAAIIGEVLPQNRDQTIICQAL